MISKGDKVRIKATGKYHDQIARLSVIDGRRMRGKRKRGYRLLVDEPDGSMWAIPQYFTVEEIELVQKAA